VSGFTLHGIDHLSASSLNTAAAELGVWLLERLLDKRAPVGAAAHRGTAIEAGVVMGLLYLDKPVSECQALAVEKYDSLTALSGDPNRDKEREAVAPTVEVALKELRPYGQPTHTQRRIEKPLGDGLPPLLGFSDIEWEQHGIVLDLKTQLRLSSDISANHGRQVAGYVHQTNSQGRVAYCSPKKIGVYPLDRVDERFQELVTIARRLDKFLSISSDPAELAAIVMPDPDSFYWSHPIAKANRIETFGY
jgi:hypothetical protein